jgi:ligand-binding SRPBCC domain-containing protein
MFMNFHVEFEQWTPVAIEQVFLFFADPNNLPRIMPPATGTKIVALRLAPPPRPPNGQAAGPDRKHLAGPGSEIVTSFRLFRFLPLRAQWLAVITEFEWNHHFADVQKKGPFKRFRHRHEFTREVRDGITGTQVRDAVDYDPGFGFLGTLAQRFFIAHQLQDTFAYRQQTLERLLS